MSKFHHSVSGKGQTVGEYFEDLMDELYARSMEESAIYGKDDKRTIKRKGELVGSIRAYVVWKNFWHSDEPITLQDALQGVRSRVTNESYGRTV